MAPQYFLNNSAFSEYKNLPYVSFYKIRKPCLIIRDANLLKIVFSQEFRTFQTNDIDVDEKLDPLFAKNPSMVTGPKWKLSRNEVTPCFSSGKVN